MPSLDAARIQLSIRTRTYLTGRGLDWANAIRELYWRADDAAYRYSPGAGPQV